MAGDGFTMDVIRDLNNKFFSDKHLFELKMMKLESEKTELIECLHKAMGRFSKIQEQHSNMIEALEMARRKHRQIVMVMQSLEEKNRVIGERISGLEKTIGEEQTESENQVALFEEQLEHMASLLQEGREYYTLDNLNTEKSHMLHEIQDAILKVTIYEQEYKVLLIEMEKLENVQIEEKNNFKVELAVLKLLEEENVRSTEMIESCKSKLSEGFVIEID